MKKSFFLLLPLILLCAVLFIAKNRTREPEEMRGIAADEKVPAKGEKSREVLTREKRTSSTYDFQAGLASFLSAGSPEEQATIASQIVQAVVQQPDAARIKADLLEVTGALIGASGDGASEIVPAIVSAAGTNRTELVLSAILIAAPVAKSPDAVRAAAIQTSPDGSNESVRFIPEQNEDLMAPELQQTVFHAAEGFKLIQENWDAEQGKLKRDIFADRDGGETPYSRETEER
jgi:hypothetical protein